MNISALHTLWFRELRKFTRSKVQNVSGLLQPVLWLLVMGFGLGPVFSDAGRGSYLQFITPSVIAMMVVFPATFSGMGLLLDRQFGSLKATLVAPVPRLTIMLGRTSGVATVALIQGTVMVVICLLAGFRPVNLAMAPVAVAFLVLISLVFAGFGLVIGASLKSPESFGLVMNFVMSPLMFLSGAFFPLDNLPLGLAALTHVNPLSYAVDGLRAVLIGQSYFGASLDAAVLIVLVLVLFSVGAWRFSKIEA